MRILISGASGYVGKSLFLYFQKQGHMVVQLTRSEHKSELSIQWDPKEGRIVKENLEGFDIVIHLAGDPLTLSRWGRKKKESILYSRTVSTWLLSRVLSQLYQPPRIFISASAIGFYGDSGEDLMTENSPPGENFLSRVCVEWERATEAIANRGSRTVQTRFGMVIGPDGGAIKKMLPAYKWGLGGKVGDGKQWMSWIALADLVSAIDFCIKNEEIEGPVNFVSPNPVRQEELAKTLAELLHRPAFFSLPKWLLKLRFGEMADVMLLSSTRVQPAKLQEAGFSFAIPNLEDALKVAIR